MNNIPELWDLKSAKGIRLRPFTQEFRLAFEWIFFILGGKK